MRAYHVVTSGHIELRENLEAMAHHKKNPPKWRVDSEADAASKID